MPLSPIEKNTKEKKKHTELKPLYIKTSHTIPGGVKIQDTKRMVTTLNSALQQFFSTPPPQVVPDTYLLSISYGVPPPK